MGIECLKPIQASTAVFPPNANFPPFSHQNKESITFQISVHNLRINNLSKEFAQIRVQYFRDKAMLIPRLDFNVHGNIVSSQCTYRAEFISQVDQIDSQWVTVTLQDHLGATVDQLKMKLMEVIMGPIKHDHFLEHTKGRMLFDWRMEQSVEVSVSLDNISVDWKNPSHSSDYTYMLSLIVSSRLEKLANSIKCVQSSRRYDKHKRVKSLGLQRIKIGISQLREAVLKLELVSTKCGGDNFEMFFSYAKLHERMGFRLINVQNIPCEVREQQVKGQLRRKCQVMGEIGFNLTFYQSRVYAEQMECVVRSEDGIVLISPGGEVSNGVLDWSVIQVLVKKLRTLRKEGAAEIEFYRLLDKIYSLSVDKEFSVTEDVCKHQQLLLALLVELVQFLQSGQQLKRDYVWRILNELCRKDILNLKYFSCIKSEGSKKSLALKFYHFVVVTLIKIIGLTQNRLSLKEVASIHRFIAFVYFRFPFFQQQIIEAISSPGDPTINEQKMSEIGADRSLKSCCKSYFYDWETSLYRLVQKQPNFMQDLQKLHKISAANPKWVTILFSRDCEQLFYSLYQCLWDQAQVLLDYNGRVLWQYFPHYDSLLSIFMGQLKYREAISKQMMHFNRRLMSNSRLLNTFMLLIFPKACLSEIYTVLQCLDLIKSYFEVVQGSGRKLPPDFRYSYFYMGIIAILESNHAVLLQRILGIIFTSYEIFAEDFKEMMNTYFINKVFFQLFLHWSREVRSIFHLLVVFKIGLSEADRNLSGKYKTKVEESGAGRYFNAMVEGLYTLRSNRDKLKKDDGRKYSYFQRMRQKLRQKQNFKKEESTFIDESQIQERHESPKCCLRINWPTASVGNIQKYIIQFQNIEPTNQELRHLDAALKQFEQIKLQPHPNQIVEARSRTLEFIIDH